MRRPTDTTVLLLVVSLTLMLVGSLAAGLVQRDNGRVEVTEVSFLTEDGATLNALLYVPEAAQPDHPVPAVVTSHGYNNTAELQAINAVELARRGLVVISIDAYGHGDSTFPDPRVDDGLAPDMGAYSALQYAGRLPYVDPEAIGMVGHSMGSANIQAAALRAFELHRSDPGVVVPHALLVTSNAFLVTEDASALVYAAYPVNVGAIFGQFDQWAPGMWGVEKGSDVNTSPVAEAGMGFAHPEYGTFFRFGDPTALDRGGAIDAAAAKTLRILYSPPIDHPQMHFSGAAASQVIEFFDVTLMGGSSPIPASSQTWFAKELATGIALLGFFLFIPVAGLLLLRTRVFRTIVRPAPESTTVLSGARSRVTYAALLILGLLPAPFVYLWATGYPIAIKSSGRSVPIVFPADEFFQMPIMNGLALFNVAAGVVLLILLVVGVRVARSGPGRPAGGAISAAFRIPGREILKALLLAALVFAAAYLCLAAADFWFLTDFRFYVFSVMTMTPAKFVLFAKYLPFFAFFFILSSLALNMSTRIRAAKEWINVALFIIASVGSLALLAALDAIFLYTTGVKLFLHVPYPEGTTSALAGVLLWGLLFILPIAAVYARVFFNRTGSIWVGGFLNSFVVTFFALSNTVVGAGVL
jgi:pimeloyl-ACP methyl ester carboxylesterase/predicted secreted protein